MTMLKTGDTCPICGRKIKTEDLDALELLNKGVRPGDCQEGKK